MSYTGRFPSKSGNDNKYLRLVSGLFSWVTVSGSGSPGGSTTQVQYNDAGSFTGDAGMTYNATTDTLTVSGSVHTPSVQATSSAGGTLKSNSGSTCMDWGAGGGQNVTFEDGVKLNASTADRILSTDSNKNITALNTTTYPSLTELSYVKGVTSAIQTQLNGKEPTITNGYGISGTSTKAVSLNYASAFATQTTTVSSATYNDLTGCSVTLAAGTWLIMAHVVAAGAAVIIQCFGAITDGDNNVIAESAISRPASGTTSLNSPISMTWQAIVTPASSTTYKLRGARGLTTHTSSWVAYDGNGYNTTNHATNNSDKGTSIIAIRLA